MQLTAVHRVPASVGRVMAALLDPAFVEALGRLPKLAPPELLDQQQDGDVVVQRVRHRFTAPLSAAVRRVVDPAKLTWVDERRFDLAAATATFRITPDHYADRLRCAGTFTFTPANGDTVRTADAELAVSVPLVGRLVERTIAAGIEEHLDREQALLQEWLEVKP